MEWMIHETEIFVRRELEGESSGHDWWHINRVTNMARRIAEEEGADLFICTMAALLHDLADDKLYESEEAGLKRIQEWIDQIGVKPDEQEHILTIIKTISFKGGHGPGLSSLEAKVVQDADRLDAIGAIGIARCFAYAGSKGHIIHHPDVQPRESMTTEEYRNSEGTGINHFYEKLLKLKDLMNTKTGFQIAEKRHEYMQQFLNEFCDEWNGIT
ncbi:HD domain-containing protein [Tenuibacillus multivorans]|uniref:HD domain-containing protein n=1 Tax=Tenuibacillus multivorans TaxID=237069 RepID=A0A1H0B154_9BACI|nr:HD domain-containing protein [Tenuibacillus multivorans]GEL77589.1 phosphohydrolase [Tenuibacillus multivorans]SDN39033.1 uncharacterized protein SAMN05216498_2159 [Tenuibacillus multivorans]